MQQRSLYIAFCSFALSCSCVVAPHAHAERSEAQIRAAQYLSEAKRLCEADAGTLWGVSLCGPMLLVDRQSRDLFANQADRDGQLQETGDIFTGKLPPSINIANTAVEWAGVKWTMVALPLPTDRQRRATLLAHEMWHRVQDQLGLPSSNPANNHLDTRDGRYWLQLEWRALAAALQADGNQQADAIRDAALFRAQRHRIFRDSAEEERALEMNEGLAEYTGVRLSSGPDAAEFIINVTLKEAPAMPTFVRSFAYRSGPAYGVLLDQRGSAWRKDLRATDDFAELLLRARGLSLPKEIDSVAAERAKAYGGDALATAETEREQRRLDAERMYRGRLIDGPRLTIRLAKMSMEFDPLNLVPVGSAGTVYPTIRVVDNWGILEVKSGGALMSPNFDQITVAAPRRSEQSGAEGDGWRLELKPGWHVVPDETGRTFRVESL